MNVRRAAPFAFAALCVALSGFVLRGQIAARPLPSPMSAPEGPSGGSGPSLPSGPPQAGDHPRGWHVAAKSARRAVRAAIGAQLAAIRAGDADRAWFYQSHGLHRNFPSAQTFQSSISDHYPEFGHAASASYGPVWSDPAGNYASVAVTVRGQNGKLAPAYYLLVKEDGGYKVASVFGGEARGGP